MSYAMLCYVERVLTIFCIRAKSQARPSIRCILHSVPVHLLSVLDVWKKLAAPALSGFVTCCIAPHQQLLGTVQRYTGGSSASTEARMTTAQTGTSR